MACPRRNAAQSAARSNLPKSSPRLYVGSSVSSQHAGLATPHGTARCTLHSPVAMSLDVARSTRLPRRPADSAEKPSRTQSSAFRAKQPRRRTPSTAVTARSAVQHERDSGLPTTQSEPPRTGGDGACRTTMACHTRTTPTCSLGRAVSVPYAARVSPRRMAVTGNSSAFLWTTSTTAARSEGCSARGATGLSDCSVTTQCSCGRPSVTCFRTGERQVVKEGSSYFQRNRSWLDNIERG